MLNVAVVGSGPAGLYAAEALVKQAAALPVPVPVRVDVIDRLPTPYGLVRYGVAPDQVPDFIALRGDPSDKIPGARGVGAKTAASLLAQYGTLDAMLDAGRFAAEADALRMYRLIATFDAKAPLPGLPGKAPDWNAIADAADELGLARLAGRVRESASS